METNTETALAKVGIQGVKGAFHEEAALNYFGEEIGIVPQVTFTDLIESVKSGESDFGMIAVENTISGTIHSNLSLIRSARLKIVGEVYLRIEQNLAALPGTKIDELQQVLSHYMAIDQCRDFFSYHPQIKLTESEDTAMSMQMVANQQLKNVGAIGSKTAALHYGLEILASGIETNKKNYTRFLVVQKPENELDCEFDKASLALTLPNSTGSLAEILSLIASFKIDLSKIESVPVVGEPWHYLFYLDLLFDEAERYLEMLKTLRPFTDELYILGEYKSNLSTWKKIHENGTKTL
jgi:prephenate dehydratase